MAATTTSQQSILGYVLVDSPPITYHQYAYLIICIFTYSHNITEIDIWAAALLCHIAQHYQHQA